MIRKRARGCIFGVLKIGTALFVVLLLLAVATHQGRVALKSAGFLVEVFPSAPAYPLRWFTDEPVREQARYKVGDRDTTANIYRPAGEGRHGAMIFYIGVGPEHQNQHVVRVSRALARSGIVTMLPVSPALSEFRVTPGETEDVVAAFKYLSAQPYVDPARIGIFGISAGGSLAALGAADPRIRDDVRLLDLFGSYYSAVDGLSALTLRQIEVQGEWQAWQPEEVSIQVFRDAVLSTLPELDREPLRPLFEGVSRTIPANLSPPARSVAELLVNRDPARVPQLLAAMSPEVRRFLESVSPKGCIGDLRTELFLMHDRDDAIIPFTESRRFYNEAMNTRAKHLTELRLFRHVEPSASSPLVLISEGSKLYRHVYAIFLRLT